MRLNSGLPRRRSPPPHHRAQCDAFGDACPRGVTIAAELADFDSTPRAVSCGAGTGARGATGVASVPDKGQLLKVSRSKIVRESAHRSSSRKIRVLDARGNAVQVRQFADRELRQETRGFGASDRGEDGHWLGPKV
jgi:hypothetical protein